MKTTSTLAVALAAVAVSANPSPVKIEARATSTSGGSLPTVTAKGNALWAGNDRFYIRGIDYQPGGSSDLLDPLADESICTRDIANFQKLGLNTIRVYTVDNTKNHDKCMSLLAAAGIYLALDVNTPLYSLNRDDPGVSYNPTYLQNIFATMDAFAGYSNLLLFFSGNEVLNMPNTTNAAPYVKAVTRDMKQYIGERGFRAIPVGYSAADVSQNQYLMAQYMDCGAAPSRSDFYAINNYQWCDPSSFQTAWSSTVEQYSNYSLPLFFSEYGCITNTRTFAETKGLYQTDMTGVFSGGLVYEYSNEADNPGYGVVNIKGNQAVPISSQFNALMKNLKDTSNPSGNGGYSPNNPPQDCPGQSKNWDTKPWTGSSLPATPSGAAKYFKSGAGKGVGFGGKGSQEAPGGSSATASSNAGAVTQTYGTGASGPSSTSSGSSAASPLTSSPMSLFPVMVSGMVVALGFAFGLAIF